MIARADRKKPVRKKPPNKLTGDQLYELELEDRRVTAMKVRAVTTFVMFLGAALFVLALTPVAAQFAGEETVLNVTVSLAIGVSLVGVAAAIGAWGRWERKRANVLDARNGALCEGVHDLQKRLKDAGKPHHVSAAVQAALAASK